MLKLLHRLQSSKDFWFVLIASLFFFLMRLPSFFEPYWYGDEGIYEIIGYALRHGRLLYQGIWDNKPPLLYLIYAAFNGEQTPVRMFSFLVGLAAVIIFFFLTKKLFTSQRAQYATTFLFSLLLGLPFLEGNIANAENFMILPSVISAYFVVGYVGQKNNRHKQYSLLIGAGLLLGLSFLTKVVAVFDAATLWAFLFILTFDAHSFKNFLKQALSYSIIFFVSFFTPLLLTILFFAAHGATKIFFQSAFFSNVGYVNYGNQFIIPQGLLIAKLLLLIGICIFLFFKRFSFSKTQLFIYLWLSFSLFSALFSQRPYTHYLLVLIASLSLFVGLLIENTKLRLVHGILLLGLLIFLGSNFWYYAKIIPYYENFASYVFGQKNTTDYEKFFDKSTVRDYDIVSYLRTVRKNNEPIFVWGNSAQIYKLANTLPPGRYTVAYHITTNQTTLKETQAALIQTMPKYVIILQNAEDMPYQLKHYQVKISFDKATIYERTY